MNTATSSAATAAAVGISRPPPESTAWRRPPLPPALGSRRTGRETSCCCRPRDTWPARAGRAIALDGCCEVGRRFSPVGSMPITTRRVTPVDGSAWRLAAERPSAGRGARVWPVSSTTGRRAPAAGVGDGVLYSLQTPARSSAPVSSARARSSESFINRGTSPVGGSVQCGN